MNMEGKTQTELMEILQDYQQALEHEKRYHDTLDNLLEGFQIIGFDWRYQYVNNTVIKQSKFSREELIGYTMMEKYPGIENTELFKTLSLCMQARISSVFENKFTYPDGTVGWFELSIQPTELGLTILSNDVTEKKRAERDKIRYTHALERIIFSMSHKVRQPVAHLLGLVNLVENCHLKRGEIRKIWNYIKDSVKGLDMQTRDITQNMEDLYLNSRK
jgi:PAS domain S-box-containing protein